MAQPLPPSPVLCEFTTERTQPDTVYVSAPTPPTSPPAHNYCQGAEIDIRFIAHNDDGTLTSKRQPPLVRGVYFEQPNPWASWTKA